MFIYSDMVPIYVNSVYLRSFFLYPANSFPVPLRLRSLHLLNSDNLHLIKFFI